MSDAFQGFLIPSLSVLLLNMLAILPLAFLGLLYLQSQRVQGQSITSISFPLAVRSPYLNCWFVQTNASLKATHNDLLLSSMITTLSNLSHVCPVSESNSTLHLRSLRLC